MKKLLFLVAAATLISTSCSKEFMKKQEAKFKVNGTQYNVGEDGMSAGYFNGGSSFLAITPTAGNSQTIQPTIVVNLNKLNQVVQIDSAQEGFNYLHTGSIQYIPKRGTWKITSHKEGNPASRHTEGNFDMVVFNPQNPADSLVISEGYFYVNNY
ncbi:MAG: hypothetical protein M9931_07080 [Chitinophagales bacterium]|nr:hypothetical protein [Chitinophagales bacterium]MCO5280800.1 hypothetical protein [Chitinophagales bacterium]OJV25126.1 MAG: hypothetical protein BGO32_08405 [Bacteroidetes bacterium 37-13]HRN93211.1 hypothetical protein [Chitinophagales bacterium]HRP39536.1 hypothetical protein [Chitinophagales bacterium]